MAPGGFSYAHYLSVLQLVCGRQFLAEVVDVERDSVARLLVNANPTPRHARCGPQEQHYQTRLHVIR